MALKHRPELFWDIDLSVLDRVKHNGFIIERVATRGRFDEFKQVLAEYGAETVRDTLLQCRWLDRKSLSYFSTLFEIPETEFRCYKLAQSNPEHWHY